MRWPVRSRRLLVGVGSVLGLAVALALGYVFVRGRTASATHEVPATAVAAEPASAPAERAVTVSEEKASAAGLAIGTATTVSLPFEVSVPGRIEADVDRSVEIRSRVPGIIRSVAVLLGQSVKAGDLLVTLDSADVATARLNLRGRQRDLAIARTESEWRTEVEANIADLIPALRKQLPAPTIEKEFASRPLGNDRALLLSAYAEWDIARHEEEKQSALFQKKIVGEHAATVAQHTREGAQARFEAALEQVRHDARRLKRQADQEVRLAEAAVIDAGERLRILGVPADLNDLVARPEKALDGQPGELTIYPIVAPFDGTIVARAAVPSQRAEPADVLMTLTDLSKVRVVANVSESDFAAITGLKDATVRVTATAYPDREFTARVLTMGAQVEPTTRTVVLLAETANSEGLLKLGMFVRVAIDSSRAETVTVVPSGAVVEIEGQSVVFVPGKDRHTFTAQPVTLGREVNGQRAIASGLKPGDSVVTSGGFALKSELILQNQEEE